MPKATCSVDGCVKKVVARGWCGPHYNYWKAHDRVGPKCAVEQCDELAYCRTWCRRHYNLWQRNGEPIPRKRHIPPKRPCSIEGCNLDAICRTWCKNHYTRERRTGDPLPPRNFCRQCGTELIGAHGSKRWCNTTCYHLYADPRRTPEQRKRQQRYQRASYLANIEKIKARTRAWQLAHPEHVKIYQERKRGKPPSARRRAQQKAYAAANKERLYEKLRAYHKAHPEMAAMASARRRALKRGVPSEPSSLTYLHARDKGICGLCGKPVRVKLRWPDPMSGSADHIIPLFLGGDDTRANKQLAHLSCNQSKGVRARGEQLRLIG